MLFSEHKSSTLQLYQLRESNFTAYQAHSSDGREKLDFYVLVIQYGFSFRSPLSKQFYPPFSGEFLGGVKVVIDAML